MLSLPEGWVVKTGEVPAEVGYSKEFGGYRWVVEGEAHHYVANLTGNEVYALSVKCRSAKNALPSISRDLFGAVSGRATVSGHECAYAIGQKKVGFLIKRPMHCIRVSFRCNETSRDISMEMLGRGSSSSAMALIKALNGSRCHS